MREGPQVAALAGLDVYTVPPKVAQAYRDGPAAVVDPRVEEDPAVALAQGVALEDFNGATLWDVPAPFKECVDALLEKDLGGLTPDGLRAHFEQAGFMALLK